MLIDTFYYNIKDRKMNLFETINNELCRLHDALRETTKKEDRDYVYNLISDLYTILEMSIPHDDAGSWRQGVEID